MKWFKVKYKEYGSNTIKEIEIMAECEADAVNKFFDNYSGMYLRCEFDKWA